MPLSTVLLRRLVPVFAALSLWACTPVPAPIDLTFALRYGDEPISCTEASAGILLTDLRFYVHDIELIDVGGNPVPFQLVTDDKWQDGRTALLDFEDGQGACDNGSPGQNASLRGVLRGGPFRALAFKVGVPEEFNHRDPLTAKAPLNYTAMHWHWLNGYKFLRAGVRNDTDGFWLHLGSSHCDGSISAGMHCQKENRVKVVLDGFDPSRNRVILDIGALISGVDLADGVPGDCSSGPDEASCRAPFAALGLGFGEVPGDPATQQVFRSEQRP